MREPIHSLMKALVVTLSSLTWRSECRRGFGRKPVSSASYLLMIASALYPSCMISIASQIASRLTSDATKVSNVVGDHLSGPRG